MRVLIVSPEFLTYNNQGGVATFNYNLAKLLLENGHEVHVITSKKEKIHLTDRKESFHVHLIPEKLSLISKTGLFFLVLLPGLIFGNFLPDVVSILEWNFYVFITFLKLQKKKKFDVIHTSNYNSPAFSLFLFFRHIPLIIHNHGPHKLLATFQEKTLNTTACSLLESAYTRYCSTVVVPCSKNVEAYLLNEYPEMRNKIHFIPNFIDIRMYKNVFIKSKNTRSKDIVFLGKMEIRKGVDFVLKSFVNVARKNQKVRLWMIGKYDPSFSENLQLPSNITKRIFFIPQIDDPKALISLLGFLNGIALLPSRYEPFGFVFIEMMMMNFLVIAGKNSGAKEIIKNGSTGFLSELNLEDLTQMLLKILDMPLKERMRISAAARKLVQKKYSFSAVREEYKKLYKNFKK